MSIQTGLRRRQQLAAMGASYRVEKRWKTVNGPGMHLTLEKTTSNGCGTNKITVDPLTPLESETRNDCGTADARANIWPAFKIWL